MFRFSLITTVLFCDNEKPQMAASQEKEEAVLEKRKQCATNIN